MNFFDLFEFFCIFLFPVTLILKFLFPPSPPSPPSLTPNSHFLLSFSLPPLPSPNTQQILTSFYELFLGPASTILDRYFESEVLKTTLATDAVVGTQCSPTWNGSAYVLLHHVMGSIPGLDVRKKKILLLKNLDLVFCSSISALDLRKYF
jgi:hypothetical protein